MVSVLIYISIPKEKTYTVKKQKIVRAVFATGYLKAKDQVTLRAEGSGYVDKIFVKEGDFVKAGSILAQIRNEVIPRQIEEVSAQYELAYKRAKEGSDYIEGLKARIIQAEENYNKAKLDYERKKALYSEGLVSQKEFETAEKNLIYTEKELKIARTVYNDSLIALKKELDSLSARKKGLEKELEKYTVKAPFDGYILSVLVDPGDYVDPFKENRLLVIGNKNEIEGVLIIDEEYVPLIKIGQKVLVSFDAFPDKNFDATIKSIDLASERTSRTVEAKIDLKITDSIPLNSVFEASIILEEKEAIVIPKEAYKDGYVWIKNGLRKTRQSVQIGNLYQGFYEVISGLSEGQTILIK
ncbi:efflux RND transporter periplasmic adaptor subunit [Thermodesulfovibrio hydrogeniphilus]